MSTEKHRMSIFVLLYLRESMNYLSLKMPRATSPAAKEKRFSRNGDVDIPYISKLSAERLGGGSRGG